MAPEIAADAPIMAGAEIAPPQVAEPDLAKHQGDTDRQHQQPRRQQHPRCHPVRGDWAARRQVQSEAENHHRAGVHRRHDRAEKDGVAGSSPRASEVGGRDRLAGANLRGIALREHPTAVEDDGHFVINGAMKAGTTSLAPNLGEHPDVFVPKREVHFCNRYWDRGADWYYSWFNEPGVRGEKSPKYMLRRRYMARLAKVAPDALLIASIRDPAIRLISHVNRRIETGGPPPTGVLTVDWLRRHVIADESLAWDMVGSEFAGRHLQYEKFYAGASFIVRNHAFRETPWNEFHKIVDDLMASYDVPQSRVRTRAA
jgi:hypothetical protein